jgi:hypothetical protein
MTTSHGQQARLEVIPHGECLRLLDEGRVGRIGGVWDDEPHVVPVNYRWDGSAVVCRLDPGLTLRALADRTVVFEIDGFDATARTGWSVIVRGRAVEAEAPAGVPLDPRTEPVPWAPGAREHRVRIEAASVSGRRVARPDPLDNQWWRMSAGS